MRRVAIVGAGPAGLAAAERILAEGRDVEITLYCDKAYMGGKAASWDLGGGLLAENGQHICLGFYHELPALLHRSNVDFRASTVSNEGHWLIQEDRDGRTHHLHFRASTIGTLLETLQYTGWTFAEKMSFTALVARVLPQMVRGPPEAWDDECLTAWCLRRGLARSVCETNAFRATRDAQLNWPGEISAWAMLRTIGMAGRDWRSGEGRFPAGGMSEIWWEPIARRIGSMGGQIVRGRKLLGLEHHEGRVTGLLLGRSNCLGHDDERASCHEGEAWVGGFDDVILAVPPLALWEILARTPELRALPAFHGAGRLLPTVPLGLHVWHREKSFPRFRTVVVGLPPPLEFVLDNKPIYPGYRDDPAIGAALHFVGQETGFEDLGDEALLLGAMAALRSVEGFKHFGPEGILAWRVVRNREPHQRYWNAEPGSLRLRPGPRTPVKGLWLAGDWIRNDLDFPCMEAAIHSGRECAGMVLAASV